ncbi:MAG: HEAT repeat domain-containing protein [Candidatus Neomarinimicrobiota bacterium]
MKPDSTQTKRLKRNAILRLYNELSGKELTKFEKSLAINQDLQNYINEIQFSLHSVAFVADEIPSAHFLTQQRSVLLGSIKSKPKHKFIKSSVPKIVSFSKVSILSSRVRLYLLMILGILIVGTLIIKFTFPNTSMPSITSLAKKPTEYKIRASVDSGLLSPENIKFSRTQTGELSFEFSGAEISTYNEKVNNPLVVDLLCYILLNSTNPGRRLQSVKQLAEVPDNQTVKDALITTLLSDPNQGIRLKSIRLLGEFTIVDVVIKQACMKALLDDKNNTIRMEALSILSNEPDDTLLPILQVVSQMDENEFVRSEAARLLQEIVEET